MWLPSSFSETRAATQGRPYIPAFRHRYVGAHGRAPGKIMAAEINSAL
jgi:hypothetical protein